MVNNIKDKQMSKITIKNNINSELAITHVDNKPAKSIVGSDITVAVDTINDFPLDASDGDTVIVRDLNRGGTFIYYSSKVAEHNDGTNFNGWIRQYDGPVNVKWFGAVGDGITDDTIAIQNAINYINTFDSVFLPSGQYNISSPLLLKSKGIIGAGTESVLKSDNTSSVLELSTSGLWEIATIKDISIDGNSKQAIGIHLKEESAGRFDFETLFITNCSKGVFKENGNIGNYFKRCAFSYCNYGIYITSAPDMHGGSDYLLFCHFQGNDIAGIYMNSSTSGTGQYILDACILEQNPGFAIFVENFIGAGNPFELRNVWVEQNHTASSVKINGTSYVPKDFYFNNVSQAKVFGTVLSSVYIEASDFIFEKCKSFSSNDIKVINSSIKFYNCKLDSGLNFQNCSVNSYDTDASKIPQEVNIFSVSNIRKGTKFVTKKPLTKIYNIPEINGGEYIASFDGMENNLNLLPDFNGNKFSSCLTKSATKGNRVDAYSFPVNDNDLYYIKAEIKINSGTIPSCYIKGDCSVISEDFGDLLKIGEFRTVHLFGTATNTGNVNFWLSADNGDFSVSFGACTVVKVTNTIDIIDFVNSNIHIMSNVKSEFFDSEIRDTYVNSKQGDIVWNTNASSGENIGWVCVAEGSPGTWEPFGIINTDLKNLNNIENNTLSTSDPTVVGQLWNNNGVVTVSAG